MLFYIIEKILAKLSRPFHPVDVEFLEELLPCLESEVRCKNLPVSCSSNAIALLLKLEKIINRNLPVHHIVTVSERTIECVSNCFCLVSIGTGDVTLQQTCNN